MMGLLVFWDHIVGNVFKSSKGEVESSVDIKEENIERKSYMLV